VDGKCSAEEGKGEAHLATKVPPSPPHLRQDSRQLCVAPLLLLAAAVIVVVDRRGAVGGDAACAAAAAGGGAALLVLVLLLLLLRVQPEDFGPGRVSVSVSAAFKGRVCTRLLHAQAEQERRRGPPTRPPVRIVGAGRTATGAGAGAAGGGAAAGAAAAWRPRGRLRAAGADKAGGQPS